MCSELKNRRGCVAGSQHEKFMKEHCNKTCGLCGTIITKQIKIERLLLGIGKLEMN